MGSERLKGLGLSQADTIITVFLPFVTDLSKSITIFWFD